MWKYYLGAALTIPLLPLLYFQGKRVKASVPKLPLARDPSGAVIQASTPELRLLLLGESTVAGVGVDRHEEGFAGALAQSLSIALNRTIRWEVHAKSGYTAEKVRTCILPNIETPECDLIVVGLGENDAFGLHSPWQWQRSVGLLIDDIQVKYPGTPIVFANMPPIKLFPAFTGFIKFTVGNLVELLGESLNELVARRENVFYSSELITLDI